MEIKSLDITVSTLEGLYDLHTGYYDLTLNLRVYQFLLEDRHSGRPWLISYDIYQNTNNVDILCDFNGIYNPLTVKAGQVLYYVHADDVPVIRNSQNTQKVQNAILSLPNPNAGKNQKVDSARAADKAKQQAIQTAKKFVQPPNLAKGNNISYGDGSILILPNF